MPETNVVTDADAREFNRLRNKLGAIKGIAPITVQHTPNGLTIGLTPAKRPPSFVDEPKSLVKFGKLTALWLAGNAAVTLQPCVGLTDGTNAVDSAGTALAPIVVNIIMPWGAAPAYLLGAVNDIFAYDEIATGQYLLRNPQTTPIPTRKGEVIQNIATSATPGKWASDYFRGYTPT